MTIRVSRPSTVSNVDPNTDFTLVDVVTGALYCAGSVAACVIITYPQHGVNRQWTAALGAIKGDKPSLTAAVTAPHMEVALVSNAESSVISLLVENTVLRDNLPIYISQSKRKDGSFVPKIYNT